MPQIGGEGGGCLHQVRISMYGVVSGKLFWNQRGGPHCIGGASFQRSRHRCLMPCGQQRLISCGTITVKEKDCVQSPPLAASQTPSIFFFGNHNSPLFCREFFELFNPETLYPHLVVFTRSHFQFDNCTILSSKVSGFFKNC